MLRYIDPDCYKTHINTTLGEENVDFLQLCEMATDDETGYYKVHYTKRFAGWYIVILFYSSLMLELLSTLAQWSSG